MLGQNDSSSKAEKNKMKSENKYIGDEAFGKMLEHYKCPTPLDIVRLRFAGAVCSPNLELRPSDVISSFWPQGQAPRLETKDEADLFFKFFMGLWDEVFENVKLNRIRLPKQNPADLKFWCEARFNEIEWGYVEGFWGGKQDLKIPAYLAEMIDSLSDLAGVYRSLEKKLDNSENSDEIIQTLEHTDKMVEKSMAFIIENSVLPRIESLTRVVH